VEKIIKKHMELNNFIENIASLFDETNKADFEADTEFKLLDEWSSLAVLLIISMVDEKYNVIMTGDEVMASETIEDLYNLVNEKM
jgi:acyl carrier protein